MIQKIKNGLKKRKVKLFLVFLLCSFLAWFLNNLSGTYTSSTTFDLNFVNLPKNKMLVSASQDQIDVVVEAVGFQFLRLNFSPKKIDLNLDEVIAGKSLYFLTKEQYQKQIVRQLSSSIQLKQVFEDTLFFDFQVIDTKELVVDPIVKMTFEQNYFLDGDIRVEPAAITVTGPKNEIDTFTELKTPELVLSKLAGDFSKKLQIDKPDSLTNTKYSSSEIIVSGSVSRFSEKLIEVPIRVLNIPKSTTIRTFPDKVEILCKAKMEDLKRLSSSDFQVVANYKTTTENSNSSERPEHLILELRKQPKHIHNAILTESKVEYILKQE